MKLGVPTLSLPKTFQDAITVTRKLGFQYLWIDSLCILQDDLEDWEIEASKMASIYENAIVTIAAGRANNDNEGFLSFRPERVYVEVFNEVNEDIYTIQAFPIALKHEFKGGFDVDMVDEPLSQRAWAFQERLLSVRTFHFGHTQVVFECRSHLYTEDGYSHPFSLDYLGQDSREKFPDIDQPVYQEDIRWIDILHRFTERALSYPSDRFPALAGLARKYDKSPAHSVVGHLEYLAGLWRSNLLEGLCWFLQLPPEPWNNTVPRRGAGRLLTVRLTMAGLVCTKILRKLNVLMLQLQDRIRMVQSLLAGYNCVLLVYRLNLRLQKNRDVTAKR